ncbi:MAG: LysM peptidoglycan-binding domain-containing protein [Patescibacteria group bacterium]
MESQSKLGNCLAGGAVFCVACLLAVLVVSTIVQQEKTQQEKLNSLDIVTVVVVRGDTVDRIARKTLGPLWNDFDLTLIRERVQELNPEFNLGADGVKPGQELKVPTYKRQTKSRRTSAGFSHFK